MYNHSPDSIDIRNLYLKITYLDYKDYTFKIRNPFNIITNPCKNKRG
jgi:hypothetical protein